MAEITHCGRADQHVVGGLRRAEPAADDQQHAGKPAASATPMRQSSRSPSMSTPNIAVSTGEMKLSAMASASGSRASAKKKVVAVTTVISDRAQAVVERGLARGPGRAGSTPRTRPRR